MSVNTGSASRAAPASTDPFYGVGARQRRFQELPHDAEPEAPFEFTAACPPHGHPRRFGPPSKLAQQRRLADPGRALDQQHPARPDGRRLERVIERDQVVLAVQKAVGGLVARSKDCGRLFGRQLCREPPFRCIIIS